MNLSFLLGGNSGRCKGGARPVQRETDVSLPYEAFVRAVELASGEKIEALQNITVDERRRMMEAKHGAPMRFPSCFPFIGRGNVLRDCCLTHEQVEAALTKALK